METEENESGLTQENSIPMMVQSILYLLQNGQGIIVSGPPDHDEEFFIVYRTDDPDDDFSSFLSIMPVSSVGGIEDFGEELAPGMIIWMHETKEEMDAARESAKKQLH